MKTMSYLVVAVAMLASAAAFALPAVELGDCSPASVGEGPLYLGILGALGALDPPDLTFPDADFDADGLPDEQAMLLLGALICADPAGTIAGQFDANVAEYLSVMTAVVDAVTGALPIPAEMTATAALCTDAVAAIELLGHPSGLEPLQAGLAALGGALAPDGAADLAETLSDFGLYASMLSGVGNYVGAMGGLSTESKAYIEGFMGYLIAGEVNAGGQDLVDVAAAVAGGAASIPPYAALIGMGVPAPIAQAVEDARLALIAVAGSLDTFGDVLLAIPAPSFTGIYGGAKTADEPFSGHGDYNGNGDTNAAVYAAVGGGAAFVAAASGANGFYEGNPALPVAGILGLSLLASACAAAGAFVIRKK